MCITVTSTRLLSAPGGYNTLQPTCCWTTAWWRTRWSHHKHLWASRSIHCSLSCFQTINIPSDFCSHSHTKSKQTKSNFICFSSHYWNFPCSSLILFSLRYEHSQQQVSSSKLDKLNYWKFTKGKGNKDLKHLVDIFLPQISSLFIQIIIKQAEGCN